MHVWLVSVPFPPHVELVALMSQHQVIPRILNQPKVNAIDALMDRECSHTEMGVCLSLLGGNLPLLVKKVNHLNV